MLARAASAFALLIAARSLAAPAPASLPAEVIVQARAQALNVNGLLCDTYALRSFRAPVELDSLISATWRGASESLPVVRARAGEWLVISRRLGERVQTVQLRATGAGGSEGYLSELNLSRLPVDRVRPALALPPAVSVQSFVQTRDADAIATQFTAWSTLTATTLLRSLAQLASRQHWSVVSMSTGLSLQRGDFHLDLLVARAASGSSLVINQREIKALH
ncbi:MAG: hypothetical protein WCD08_09820 [Steroidobacteraceae bacterium]